MLPCCDHLAGYFRTPHRQIAEEEGQSCWVDTRPLARRARSHSFADVWAPPGETGSEAYSVHHVGCGEEHGVEGLEKRGSLQVPPTPPHQAQTRMPLKEPFQSGKRKWEVEAPQHTARHPSIRQAIGRHEGLKRRVPGSSL